jgi:hypothetical protein
MYLYVAYLFISVGNEKKIGSRKHFKLGFLKVEKL